MLCVGQGTTEKRLAAFLRAQSGVRPLPLLSPEFTRCCVSDKTPLTRRLAAFLFGHHLGGHTPQLINIGARMQTG